MDTQQPSDTRPPESSPSLDLTHWGKYFESGDPPRLGMESGQRIPLAACSAFATGAIFGWSHGKKLAGYRFRAENAHRFPTTSTGWFQYHKSKSYASFVGSVKEGAKMGFKLGGGALAFCLFEETVDYARNDRRDFLSSVMAGLTFSGIYSLIARHDIYTAARTVKFGLRMSLLYGLVQDGVSTMKGHRPAYIDFIMGKFRPKTE